MHNLGGGGAGEERKVTLPWKLHANCMQSCLSGYGLISII